MAVGEDLQNVSVTVKWYKADKGFGFVRFADGSGEAFLHSSVVAPLGPVILTEGTVLVCDLAENAKGRQVTAIHSVTAAPPAEPKPARQPRTRIRPEGAEPPLKKSVRPAPSDLIGNYLPLPEAPRRTSRATAQAEPLNGGALILGTVRWYNLDSQSGLIDPWDDDSTVGVYFDRATLRRSGIEVVADGEDVRFVAQQSDDGPFAVRVELA